MLSSCGKCIPSGVNRLAVSRGHLAEKQGRAFAVALSGGCFPKAWEDQAWKEEFGTFFVMPQFSWAIVRVDSCQYEGSKPREGSHYWLSNFDLGRARGIWGSFLQLPPGYGLRGVEGTSISKVTTFAWASSVPPTPPPEPIPLPTDVMSGEALSSEDRAKLDHEVSEFSKRMQAFWKSRADAKDWDQVKADLEVYVLAGEKGRVQD